MASSFSPPPTPAVGGVLDLAAKSGDIGVRFGDFCKEKFVLENWEFILDVMAFKKVTNAVRSTYAFFGSQEEPRCSFAQSTQPTRCTLSMLASVKRLPHRLTPQSSSRVGTRKHASCIALLLRPRCQARALSPENGLLVLHATCT